jgi:hypothetical protein
MPFAGIHESMVDKRDACIATLEGRRDDGHFLYALIDLAAATDARHWLAKLMRAKAACSLFEWQPEAAAMELAPWLLRMDPDDARISLRHTVDESLMAWNVSWVETTLGLDELAMRLSQRLTARVAEGEALFRYYDPRLLPDWWCVLSDDQQASFGAFGTRWWVLDADGSLQGFDLTGVPVNDPCQRPWQPTPEEQRALTVASEHQQLVSFLGKRHPDTFLDKDRGEQWRFVRRHDLQARARHLTHLADRLRYCELALEYGDDFAGQPRWQPAWAAMMSGDQRLAEVLKQLHAEAMTSHIESEGAA